MNIQQNNNGHEEAQNSSDAVNCDLRPVHGRTEQKVILLPRKPYDPKTFWIGVLAKYFDIWAPTSPVSLKEEGSPYTFDFYSESRSKLVKIFTMQDEETIDSYLDLPYEEHIVFILDVDTDIVVLDCRYCGECDSCNRVSNLAYEMGAYLCERKGIEINCIMGENEDGDWEELEAR